MARQTIAVIDIGTRPRFERSRLAACWAIEAVSRPPLRRGAVRSAATRDPNELFRYLMYPTRLMHLMAHGDPRGALSPDYPRLWPFHRQFPVGDLARYCRDEGRLPDIDVLLLDACSSGTADWRRGLSRLVPAGSDLVLIGTARPVAFHEATTYTMLFYAALLDTALPSDRQGLQRRALRAHERAAAGFEALHRRPTCFRAALVHGKA